MRDHTIIGGISNLERQMGKDVTALYDMNILCRTRIDAFEDVLFGKRGSLLVAFVLSLFAPDIIRRRIEAAHERALDAYADRTATLAKDVINKSKITVLGGKGEAFIVTP